LVDLLDNFPNITKLFLAVQSYFMILIRQRMDGVRRERRTVNWLRRTGYINPCGRWRGEAEAKYMANGQLYAISTSTLAPDIQIVQVISKPTSYHLKTPYLFFSGVSSFLVGAHPPRLLSQVVDGQGQVIITATKIFRL
jgi:hypothetical protein